MATCGGDDDVPAALDRPRRGVRALGIDLPGQPLRDPLRAAAARGRIPVPDRRRAAGRDRALRRRSRRVPLDAAQFGTTALSGLLLPAWGNGMVVVAQQGVSSGLAALLIAAVPLWIVLLRALTGDRPRTATIAGVGVGVVGLAVLVLAGPASGGVAGTTWWGRGWCCSPAWAGPPERSRPPGCRCRPTRSRWPRCRCCRRGDPPGGGHRAGRAPRRRGRPASAWVAWAYLAWSSRSARSAPTPTRSASLPVSTVATYAYVNPVIAVALGGFVAGSDSPGCQLAGAAVVLLAVVLVVSARAAVPKTSGVPWQHPRHDSSAAGRDDRGAAARGPRWPRRGSGAAPVRAGHPAAPRAVLARLRLLQLDSVNVAVRAHYMPVFSRLGPYDAGAGGRRRVGARGAPAAAARRVLGARGQPAAGRRLAAAAVRGQAARLVGHYAALADGSRELVDDVLAAVKELGPVGAGALETALGAASAPRPTGVGWWERSDVKRVCEWLFGDGRSSPPAPACTSSGSTTCPSGCCRPRSSPRTRADARGCGAAAGAAAAAAPRRGHRAGPARLLPARAGGEQAGRRRAGRGGGAGAGRRAGLARARLPVARRADARGGSRRGRCCARSTR